MPEPLAFTLGDVVRLRKPHACGGTDWTVVRLGADIGLRCLTCQRRVLLPRSELRRRLKGFVSRAAAEREGHGERDQGHERDDDSAR